MATEVKMPALGESITEGTITRWLKKEGDRVEADEPLLEVSTDKVDTEIPAPVGGVLREIKAGEDATVEVGAVLGTIDEAGDGAGQAEGGEEATDSQQADSQQAEPGRGQTEQAESEQGEAEQGESEAAQATEEAGSAAAERAPEAADETEGDERAGQGTEQDAQQDTKQERAEGDGGRQAGGGGETTTVTMPALGESITEGTITRWLKQEGDQVEADEPLFEVSTDKVDTEVPSPVAGVLQEIKVPVDGTVQVGGEVAIVAAGGGAAAPAKAEPAGDRAEDGKGGEEPAGDGRQAQAEAEAPAERAEAAAPSEDGEAEDGEQAGKAEPYTGPVSPLVRRLAREHNIDLNKVKGTGSGGRIIRADVLSYIDQRPAAGDGRGDGAAAPPRAGRPMQAPAPEEAQPQPQPQARAEAAEKPKAPERPERPMQAPKPVSREGAPVSAGGVPLPTGLREEVVKASRIRRIIAERMVESLHTSAQLTTAVEVDMTKVMRLRGRAKDAFKQREGISLSPLPFAVLALMAAIREYPMVNSAMDADFNLHIYKDVNLGVAVDTPKGLYVPVIRNADRLNLTGLARAIADVATRTREGKIDPGELSGSTITVTNTGSVGAVWDTPIINQPNTAMYATPAIVRRPVVVDHPDLGETIAVRHMMYGILTYDHRVIDGADAARFLNKVKQVLEAADFAGELGLDG